MLIHWQFLSFVDEEVANAKIFLLPLQPISICRMHVHYLMQERGEELKMIDWKNYKLRFKCRLS
jgi:hypothetical protein